MGELVPPRDEEALASGIVAVLRNQPRYARPEHEIRELFDPEKTATFYEDLFAQLLRDRRKVPSDEPEPLARAPRDGVGPAGGRRP